MLPSNLKLGASRVAYCREEQPLSPDLQAASLGIRTLPPSGTPFLALFYHILSTYLLSHLYTPPAVPVSTISAQLHKLAPDPLAFSTLSALQQKPTLIFLLLFKIYPSI